MPKPHNAHADFFGIGNTLRLTVDLKDLPLEERRSIFNTLLMDPQVNPGYAKMTQEDRETALSWFVRFCGWPL